MNLTIKNITLEPAEGGYIIKYNCYMPSADSYDGLRLIGEKKVVLEDGKAAISKVDELYDNTLPLNEIPAGVKNHAKGNDDDY